MGSNRACAGIRGISVLEVLIVLAVLAVIGAIFLPSPQKASARADMKTAEEYVEQAVYLARSTAINTQSVVIMHVLPGNAKVPARIGFSFASQDQLQAGANAGVLDHEYVFPAEIRLESAANDVLFDATGVVQSPTQIELISSRDADFYQRLLIE